VGAVVVGAVVVGAVVVVVPGAVAVPVGVVLVVVVCAGASGAGVVELPDGGAEPVDASAASAAPDSGPPNTVNPPPASAETIARRAQKRTLFTPDMLDPCSSWFRPVVALEQSTRTRRAGGRAPP
jgi:pyruvate/2-oxoglutarate dehydrogenase complex dihydrolipoamide acyltransferase (E2) component